MDMLQSLVYVLDNNCLFKSSKGELSLVQIWDLPLKSRNPNDVTLATVSSLLLKNNELNNSMQYSLVDDVSKDDIEYEHKLVILKELISKRKEQINKAKLAIENEALLNTLNSILYEKKQESLKSLSIEELEAKVKSLKG